MKFDNPERKGRRSTLRILLGILLLPVLPVGFNLFSGIEGVNPLTAPEPAANNPADTGSNSESSAQADQGQSTESVPGTEQPPAQQEQPQPIQPPAQEPQTNPLQAIGLDKFKTVEDLGNSYKNLESSYSKSQAELAQLRQQTAEMENLKATVEQLKAAQQQPPIPEQVQKTPEQIDAENTQLAEELINNPVATLDKIKEQIRNDLMNEVKKEVEPVKSKYEMEQKNADITRKANEFASAVDATGNQLHPEFSKPEIQQAMVEIFSKNPALVDDVDGFDIAYNYALGKNSQLLQGNAPAIDPNTILSDENFMKQAANHPKIIELATQKYLEQLKNGQPPPVISGSGGGSPSPQPAEAPKTIKEAGKLLRKALGI
ncbi:MAG: hypothetical protein SFH39_00350 [Candidatus Magnetobacterium sp. LHC-1]